MAAYKNQKKAAIRLAFVNLLCFEVSVMRKEFNETAGRIAFYIDPSSISA
jgi:hypothetical protein